VEIGSRVQHLDDIEKGAIVSIQGDKATVLWDNGFEEMLPISSLIISRTELLDNQENDSIDIKDKIEIQFSKKVQLNREVLEIDIHASELLSSIKGMTNHEIVSHQIRVLKEAFKKANDERCKKLIVIHGVGKGRLKEEVEIFLNGCVGINFHDASFKSYGLGATEVVFYKYS
jgi:dsDNA-specific endonuclease/ATPase MutS2